MTDATKGVKKITSLTPEQKALLLEVRDNARKEATRTDQINFNKAKEAIIGLYKVNGFKPPQNIFMFSSPFACMAGRQLMRNKKKFEFSKSELDQFIASNSQIEYQRISFLGNVDQYWLSFFNYAKRIGLEYTKEIQEKLDAYNAFAKECHICFLYPDAALLSDRPEIYAFDQNRGLHSETGPAVKYRDGLCSIYMWKGTRIPKDLIENRHKMTVKDIIGEQNAEIRRIMVEIYSMMNGPDSILKDMKATLVSEDENQGQKRELYRIQDQMYMRVRNGSLEPDGSRRTFLISAISTAKTPHEAVAESYGRPPAKYKEAVRT